MPRSVGDGRTGADGDGPRAARPAGGTRRAPWRGSSPEAGEPAPPYSVSDDLMVVSNSATNLAWALGHLGQGASSPFAAAIGERYRRGVGWLMAVDAPPIVKAAAGDDAPPVELAGMIGLKYLFLEQRVALRRRGERADARVQGPASGHGVVAGRFRVRRRGGVPAGRRPGRRLRVHARAVAAVRGVQRAHDEGERVVRRQLAAGEREARRRASSRT